jgi:type IV pilus assembly protein PilF
MHRAILAVLIVVVLVACASQGPERSRGDEKKASQLNAELGAKYLRDGRLQTAQEKLDKAIEQDPKNADAHGAYALLSMRLGKTDEARSHFETAIDLRPDDPKIINNYATFLCQEGDYDEGIARFVDAAQNPLYESPANAYANAGQCAREAGRIDEARKYFQRALRVSRRSASALFGGAQLEYDQGRLRKARDYLERYHKSATEAPQSLWLAIRIERRLGNQDEVERLGKTLLRDYPDSDEANRFLETR